MRIALGFVLLTSALLAGAGGFIDAHPEWLARPTGVAALDRSNQIAARFGQSESALIAVAAKSGDMLDAAPLDALLTLAQELRTSGQCASVLSLLSLPAIVISEDETEIRDLIERAPKDAAERDALRAKLRSNPHAIGQIVSEDLRETMLVCPFSEKGSLSAVQAVAAPLSAAHEPAVSVNFVGLTGMPDALANDLTASALFFVVLALVVIVSERRPRSLRAGVLAALVVVQAVLVFVAHPFLWSTQTSELARLLGPSVGRGYAALDAITNAQRTLLVQVDADFNQAAELARLEQLCASVQGKVEGAVVACPTRVLETMAAALAGDAALPRTDDQLKALWFFAGDRAELKLVFTADKRSALMRVVIPASKERMLRALKRQQTEEAIDASVKALGLRATTGGLPQVDAVLGAVTARLELLLVAAALLGFGIGTRLRGRPLTSNLALGEALIAPVLLVKVGAAAYVLLAVGVLVLFVKVGSLLVNTGIQRAGQDPAEDMT